MRLGTRVAALVFIMSTCVVGLAGVASASNPVGSAKWCKNHPHSKLPACRGGGTGGPPPPPPTITVTVAPGPVVETGQSEVYAVVEAETSPSLSGDIVDINSQQLANACGGAVLFGSLQPTAVYSADSVEVTLDADGNATVSLYGIDCAPGPSLIEADLVAAPYYTATDTVTVGPPNVTTAGVTGYPDPEVETGTTPASGESDVYSVFYVEYDPVYAEQTVEISSPELFDRCGGAIAPVWVSNQGSFATFTATATLDDDGNAVFAFSGSSCAPGDSTVIADVLASGGATYSSTYTISAPAPTI
jgi:hypothetical protein